MAERDIPEFQHRADRLPNLQLLVGEENESKSDKLPSQWIAGSLATEAASAYVARHDLGDIPADITGFSSFYEARRHRLLGRLRQLLGSDIPETARPLHDDRA